MAHIVAKTTGNTPDATDYAISCTVNCTAACTATCAAARTVSTIWLSPKEQGLRSVAVLNRWRRRSGSTTTTQSRTGYCSHLQTGYPDGHTHSRRDLKHSRRPIMAAVTGQAQQARERHTPSEWWR